MKKTDVYVVVDTPKKAKKLKELLDMFGESYGGCTFELLENKEGDKVYFNMGSEWNTDTASMIHRILQEVSIKELRNILAKEHLKSGDVVIAGVGKIRYIVKIENIIDSYAFLESSEHIYIDDDGLTHNVQNRSSFPDFIRYATEEEKALLEPKKELEVGKWYAFSWDDTPNDIRGVYLIDKVENDKVWFKYGINVEDNTWSYRDWYSKSHNWRLATAKEVEQGLINESKIRGYEYTEYDYNPEENELCGTNNGRLESVFCDGRWEQPASNYTDSDVSIVERLHDTLLDNHGYSLESKLLTDARLLANKIKSNIK